MQKGIQAAVSTNGQVGALLNNDKLHAQAIEFIEQLDKSVAQIQSGQGPAGQMLRSPAQYDQLLSQAQAFRKSIVELEKNDLLQSTSVYDNATQALAAMIQTVDDFNRNPQLANVTQYDNWVGSLKELRDSLKDFARIRGSTCASNCSEVGGFTQPATSAIRINKSFIPLLREA